MCNIHVVHLKVLNKKKLVLVKTRPLNKFLKLSELGPLSPELIKLSSNSNLCVSKPIDYH